MSNKKICIYNRNGELVKKCKTREQAAAFAGVSVASVYRSIVGDTKKTHCGFQFRLENQDFNFDKLNESLNSKKVVLIKDNEVVKEYDSQRQASIENQVPQSTLSNRLHNRIDKNYFVRKYGVDFAYKDSINTNTIPKEEPVKPIKEEYYINILVGLVNRTLIDRAIYNIRGVDYTYEKEKDMLTSNVGNIERNYYCELCKVQKPLLNEKEINFLTNLLKAFNNVVGIQKCNDIYNGFEFIRIVSNNAMNNVALPKFKAGEYYANLELDKVYTLQELNI